MKPNAEKSDMLKQKIINNGYVIIDFQCLNNIHKIQEMMKQLWMFDPVELHQQHFDDAERMLKIKKAKDEIIKNDFIKKLLLENLQVFDFLFSDDIDVQANIHLRVSRPNQESDLVDWHRDTFYGNSLWEVGCWFPIFQLEEGVGLTIVQHSHLEEAKNIHFVDEHNPFRRSVTKGSIANDLGYVYAPKIDDAIAEINQSSVRLLSPKVGQAIFFFGHMIHRAQNNSNKTRISIDVRVKNMFAPTNTKPGYYQPLTRGCVAQYAESMEKLEQEVLCGN
jgi:hypothetical protein